jgi:hypothetical protein
VGRGREWPITPETRGGSVLIPPPHSIFSEKAVPVKSLQRFTTVADRCHLGVLSITELVHQREPDRDNRVTIAGILAVCGDSLYNPARVGFGA